MILTSGVKRYKHFDFIDQNLANFKHSLTVRTNINNQMKILNGLIARKSTKEQPMPTRMIKSETPW